MALSACPIAFINAPVEQVWELVSNLSRLADWADIHTTHIEPGGPTTPGQTLHGTSRALGRSWHVTMKVEMVDATKHQMQFFVELPLGITMHQRTICTPIDATSCRVQYG